MAGWRLQDARIDSTADNVYVKVITPWRGGVDEPPPRVWAFDERPLLRRVEITAPNIAELRCSGGVLDEVTVGPVRGAISIYDSAVRRLRLIGKVRMILFHHVGLAASRPELPDEYRTQNEEHNSSVDWTLDISEAEISKCLIYGVDAERIVVDPARQMVYSRQSVERAAHQLSRLAKRGNLHAGVVVGALTMHENYTIVAPYSRRHLRTGAAKVLDVMHETGGALPTFGSSERS